MPAENSPSVVDRVASLRNQQRIASQVLRHAPDYLQAEKPELGVFAE